MFLGVSATVTNWDAEGTTCSFVLEDNPLVDFVELPDTCQGLHYCNVLNGVIRGALEMVSTCYLSPELFYQFNGVLVASFVGPCDCESVCSFKRRVCILCSGACRAVCCSNIDSFC